MKVFISSVISGFEPYREAARQAIESLGGTVIQAEDFPAASGTPQQVCLQGVRDADIVVLILGERYGYPQASGLSATHEEYREARERRPVLVFIQQGVAREENQQQFVREVQSWAGGHYTADFTDAQDLQRKITRALHTHAVATAHGRVDEGEMVTRAIGAHP